MLTASPADLVNSGLDEHVASELRQHLNRTNAEEEWERLRAQGISLMLPSDQAWPRELKEIANPPRMLYVHGSLPDSDTLYLAIIGTRTITTYGRTVILDLVPPLARQGLCIVSGLAFGVDAAAHEATMAAGGRTVAVLGSGLDDRALYPKAHALLADTIIFHGGALVAEYPPGTPALKQHFIARNRIISGMSHGVLIVESGIQGGSLSTANYALEQGRSVYAVPGPIYSPTSAGTNNLLKIGATPVTEAADILVDLNLPETAPPETSMHETPDLSPLERRIFDILTKHPTPIDEIIARCSIQAHECQTALTFLELKGLIKNVGAGQYIRI